MDTSEFNRQYQNMLESAVDAEQMPRSIIDNYTFISCLRRDQQGKKAIYILKRRTDGVKALLRVTHHYPEEDALEEAKILNKLDFPGIPKVYAAYSEGERNYLIRTYVEGRTLYDMIKCSGVMPPEEIYPIIGQLCDILSYIHQKNPPVIHRDIKPQNIIMAEDGSLHLIDFGIAREEKPDQDKDTAIILTDGYAAPEQFGYGQTTALSDIYSVGALMLFLATGQTKKKELNQRLDDKHLRGLINSCTAMDPAGRFQSAEKLKGALPRRQKKAGRWIILVLILALLFGVGAAVVGVYTFIGSRSAITSVISALTGRTSTEVARDNSEVLLGNMLNGGFSDWDGKTIYYIMNNNLYAMSQDASKVELLISDRSVKGVFYYEEMLYLSTYSGLLKMDTINREIKDLGYVSIENFYIVDDTFYFTNGADRLCLYAMDLEGNNKQKMNNLSEAFYINVADGKMYYADDAFKRHLYRCNLDGSEIRLICEEECHWLNVVGDRIYCARSGSDYGLVSMDLYGKNARVLDKESASYVNVTEDGVYYMTGDGILRYIDKEGTAASKRIILEKGCGAFAVTGDWIIYESKDPKDDSMWRVRTDGTENTQL